VASPPTVEVLKAASGPTTRVTSRVEIYESNGTTPWMKENRLIEGSVSVDYSRDERRSVDIKLDNADFALKHNPDGGFWYDKIIKCFKGVSYRTLSADNVTYVDKTWEIQIGEFMIDRLTESHFPHHMSVTGRDYTKKCQMSKFTQATQFATGQALETVIRNIASNAGITKFLFPVTGKVVNRAFMYEKGVPRWQAMKEIADSYGFELYFDANAYLVLREYQDPLYAPLALVLEAGKFGNLVSYEKSTNDTRLYNHIVVTGESSDATVAPVSAEALNTEPSSPTRIARLGDRLYQYSSAFITTVGQAQDVANKFLKIHSLEEYDLNFSVISFPWIEVGEIVQFIDPNPGVGDPDRFLLSSLTIPMGLGPMSGNAKRVTVVR
jgi:hypothetical protein